MKHTLTNTNKMGLALSRSLNLIKRTELLEQEHNAELNAKPLVIAPTRRRAKMGRISAQRERNRHSQSMINMPAPPGHQLVPRLTDDKAKLLFAAYYKREGIRIDKRAMGK